MKARGPRPHMQKQIRDGKLQCTKCHVSKLVSDFNKGQLVIGYSTHCKACNAAKMRQYRKRYPARYRRAHLRRTFGIDQPHYDAMLRKQNGLCAICHAFPNGKPFHVDHEHTTNRKRGLLCDNCNMAIGLLQDDPEIVRRAARYIHADESTE